MAVLVLLGFQGAAAHAQESWDAVYLGGSKIGYIHVFVESVKDRGREYLRVRIDIELRLKRREDVAVTKLMYGTIETLDGQVLKLDTRTQVGNQDLRVHGNVIDGEMKLIIDGGGQEQSKTIPWGSEVRGPYAPEQSMARKPLKEHETRALEDVHSGAEQGLLTSQLRARTIQPVLLGDGSQRALLRVDQTTVVDGKPQPEYDARIYVDAEGQVLKSEQDVMGGIVIYRTTKENAMSPGGPVQFDLILDTVVKVSRRIPDPDQTRHIKYRITLKESDPAEVFPKDSRQTVEPSSQMPAS